MLLIKNCRNKMFFINMTINSRLMIIQTGGICTVRRRLIAVIFTIIRNGYSKLDDLLWSHLDCILDWFDHSSLFDLYWNQDQVRSIKTYNSILNLKTKNMFQFKLFHNNQRFSWYFFFKYSAHVDGYCPGYYCGEVGSHSNFSLVFGCFTDTIFT